ncbi:MAG: MFS transporter [Desulfobacterales bacterium]|jgi:predicted MFS family arabinose efflux permease
MSQQTFISSPAETRLQLILKIVVVVICRLVLSTARRFVYPFAPVLSRSLGVPLTSITPLIAVNWATSLLGVFFGPLADRFGYRKMMIFGLMMLAGGMFAGGFFPFYGVILIALFLAGLGKNVFDPAVQAYVSERVPYGRRATAIGFLEISWAGSTLLGIPLIALLIDRIGWQSPFFAMGGMGLAGIFALSVLFPSDEQSISNPRPSMPYNKILSVIAQDRASVGALAFVFFFSAAIDNLFVIYGAWLEHAFNVSVVTLGMATAIIGVAELIGEILVATISDRFGLKRAVLIGTTICIFTYGLLPLAAQSLMPALAGLFVHFLIFEFTIISSVALCTELQPGMRATVIAGFFAAAGLGRILGAMSGGPVWLAGGIISTGLVSAILTTMAFLALFWGLRGWRKG